ncbi:type II toxin-antitoxin system RelB/DinJ family antitoxin [Lactiplantibacillus nangangensis]|uniref:Type II toxin-antitoxin system RelB/DinJ family antitoxin n=1 Tax=Lactiplantibacillus nangangensis TaxID=2559917 RepID=A0ABW1SMM8_9LACO|nr:type II toxin-antitoxin system RelB/DinJ family antitoxin [Lactiplantibacillus nangangensis]
MDNPIKDRITIRIDHQQKIEAQAVAKDLGSDLSTLINIFLNQMIKENGLPFTPSNRVSELDTALDQLAIYNRAGAHQHLKELRDEADADD